MEKETEMETKNFLNIAAQAEGIARMAAPRSILAAGLAVALAEQSAMMNDEKPANAVAMVLDDFAAVLRLQGANKQEVSAKRGQAKVVGANVVARFGSDVFTAWASEGDAVQGCFAQCVADGVKSVQRLMDYMKHGDADFTDRTKQAERDAKKAEKEEAANARVAEIVGADAVDPLSLIGEPVAPAKVNLGMILANMDDAELAAHLEAVQAEIAARLAETETANVG